MDILLQTILSIPAIVIAAALGMFVRATYKDGGS